MERTFYSPVDGYKVCEDYDDGTNTFYLYTSANGVGFIMKVLNASPHTILYSTFAKTFATTLWNLTTHEPRISASGYDYWHNNTQAKTAS